MKILQNEPTNNTTTNSTTTAANSKEKQQHHTPISVPQQQQTVEKRKAKTLKNKILQNVAQQEQHYQQQQRQQQHQQNANVNNIPSAPSAMTEERTKTNYNNSCNNTKSNNSKNSDIKAATSSLASSSKLLKDSLKDTSTSNNSQNKNGSSNKSSDLIIAEAAKILLKNGLNGTNVAAAAAVATATATLLTAAANFHHLPTTSNTNSSTKCNLTTSSSSSSTTPVSAKTKLAGDVTTAAATAHAQLVAIAAAAAAVNATNQKRLAPSATSSSNCKNPNQTVNNGLYANIGMQTTSAPASSTDCSPTTTQFTKPYKTSSCKSTMPSSMDSGIFDYTLNLNSNDDAAPTTLSEALSSSSTAINLSANNNISSNNNCQQKFLNNNIHSHSNRSDIGRPPISQHHHQTSNVHNQKKTVAASGYGGRLQFFKDGKFILELARSNDGEKGGWISVPRKTFRTPSAATSSTVTPSAAASTSVAAIPSSLTASTAPAIGVSYPKNECSNSLSFSDDNSSLQSSPWQRDHCWKQAAPRKKVSKELELFYRRPAYKKFTTQALLLSQRKRRKPYDIKKLESNQVFDLPSKKQEHILHTAKPGKDVELNEEISNKPIIENKEVNKKEYKTSSEDIKKEVTDVENKINDIKEEHEKNSNSNPIAKIETSVEESKDVDVEMIKILSPSKATINKNLARQTINENDDFERKNSSECVDGDEATPKKTSKPPKHNLPNLMEQKQSVSILQGDNLKEGDEEKRLNKQENVKTRAKLTTIVQKLIDVSTLRLAAAAHRSKTSNQATTTSSSTSTSSSLAHSISTSIGLPSERSKNHSSKVSPPSNAAASRLVEYHQQHVSPRKRILREFEKVSLEDNTSGASGGKRSRPKCSNTSTTFTNSYVTSSSSNAMTTNKSMNLNTHGSNPGNTPKSAASTAPAKLYSSYSIHSLLGGGLSPSTRSTSVAKKPSDVPATITSNSAGYSPYNSPSFPLNSVSNVSPKSSEGNSSCGGKSPSNSTTKSKRSPPYSSPMHETPSRSPITSSSGTYAEYSGRRSPRSTPDTAHNSFNKMRYASGTSTDTAASPTNHLFQHHLQQHYQHHPQTYYSPYMMSPHYVPPISGPSVLSPNAVSGNSSTSVSVGTRSPRHHPSAFRATTPTSSSTTTHNIPSILKEDSSPQRSTTSSPRETTPRTVPKKTASIRRQFASPTSANNQNHNNSNCSSPTTAIDEHLSSERRTPVNSSSSHQLHQQPQHLMQRGSPGNPNLAGSPIHLYSYLYAQPSNSGNNSHILNAAGSNHPSSAISPSSVNAAAASYIPAVVGSPYYHAYISTLAAMRHPQMWAAANPALMQARHPAMLSAAARLSPSYHSFQYNGVGNAAAAAGFGSTSTPPHTSNALSHPSSMFNPMANSSLTGIQHPTTMQTAGLVPASAAVAAFSAASTMTDTTDLSKLSKTNFSTSTSSSVSALRVGAGLSSSAGSHGNSMYTISNKDEQSSDVPLNLSKH